MLPVSVAVFALTIDRLGLIAAGAIAAGMALFAAATFVWLLGLPMRLRTF